MLNGMAKTEKHMAGRSNGARYEPPAEHLTIALSTLLGRTGRAPLQPKQLALLKRDSAERDITIFYAGFIDLLDGPAVSIVGTRDVSEVGRSAAARIAKELAEAGVGVVSGLAKGVDAAAHKSAIASGGSTIAVIGTPLDRAYPAENSRLQEEIYSKHLLISPFESGVHVFKGNFPARNRVMAAVTDATVIVEASDTSGTLHQAAECQRLGRWLFISKSVVDNPNVTWPSRFLNHDRTRVLSHTDEIISTIQHGEY